MKWNSNLILDVLVGHYLPTTCWVGYIHAQANVQTFVFPRNWLPEQGQTTPRQLIQKLITLGFFGELSWHLGGINHMIAHIIYIHFYTIISNLDYGTYIEIRIDRFTFKIFFFVLLPDLFFVNLVSSSSSKIYLLFSTTYFDGLLLIL